MKYSFDKKVILYPGVEFSDANICIVKFISEVENYNNENEKRFGLHRGMSIVWKHLPDKIYWVYETKTAYIVRLGK